MFLVRSQRLIVQLRKEDEGTDERSTEYNTLMVVWVSGTVMAS